MWLEVVCDVQYSSSSTTATSCVVVRVSKHEATDLGDGMYAGSVEHFAGRL